MAIDKKILGRNIKALRTRERLSGEKFGKNLGISKSALSQIENGSTAPSLELLHLIATKYGKSVDSLLANAAVRYKPHHGTNAHNQNDGEKIFLVPIMAYAGYTEEGRKPDFVAGLHFITLPGFSTGDFRAFEVEGYSMLTDPGIGFHPGDIVIVRACPNAEAIIDNQICVLVFYINGRYKVILTRCFYRVNDEGAASIRCESDNKDSQYPSFFVPIQDVLEVWSFERKITRNAPDLTSFVERLNVYEERLTLLEIKQVSTTVQSSDS